VPGSRVTKQLTVTLDSETAARLQKRADEVGMKPEQLVAALVRDDDKDDHVDASDIADLEARWAEVQTGGETVPHQEVTHWLKAWGTVDSKPWPTSR
jgi:predicted transcriptional regulator